MKICFIHLIIKLYILGKSLSNHNYANKILMSMCRECQPKVTSIRESHDLKTLDISTLFEKLTEHEKEMKILALSELSVKN